MRTAAARLSVGHKTVPPPELILYTVAKEFGVLPWKLMNEDAADVMATYAILTELQPKPQAQSQRGRKSAI